MTIRGFILQPTYRLEKGRPVVLLHGRLEDGKAFLIRDDREVPSFFVDADFATRAENVLGTDGLGARYGARLVADERHTMTGRPVARMEYRRPADTPELRKHLQAADIPCHEADLRFARRYLIQRGLRGAVEIQGEARTTENDGDLRTVFFENPELRPSSWVPRNLAVLSFDIETDLKARRLLSIAYCGCGVSEVLIFCPEGYGAPDGTVGFRHEREVLAAFCQRLRELDPDVLTGWNVVDFDFRVLDRLAKRWRLPFEIGRGPGVVRLRESRGPWASLEATVPGRVVLDGIQMLRGSFIKMDEYSLDAVSREVLGEGKLMSGHDRGQAIVDAFLKDRERFAAYNLKDAQLVLDIFAKLGLVELAVERSLLTGLPIDRVAGAIAAVDSLYIGELGRRGLVAPSVDSSVTGAANLGGEVLEPEPGLYQDVLVCDFKSLYPSIIRTFQVDPLGYMGQNASDDEDPIRAPNGACFRRRTKDFSGILPGLIDELFPRREAAKAAGNGIASHAIKILMNSFYGVLGTPACRFYRPALAGAITAFGREILLWSKEQIESYGHRVLYGDTDSLFILAETPNATGEELVERLNADLAAHIQEKWRVESRLELELEKVYRRLLLLSTRSGGSGARKRYVGLIDRGEDDEVVFTGMEVVRRDWTELAKSVQRELYERLFHDREVDEYLYSVVKELREGDCDDQLIYRKGLRKSLEEYTATTPPHVAAARKMTGRAGRLISYVMTVAGAEPAAERKNAFDYEHYVQKQVRPVAEPVLAVLGLDFDKVVGDDTQLSLF